jgi:uncharacterized protein YjbJ (UPF0337 family)
LARRKLRREGVPNSTALGDDWAHAHVMWNKNERNGSVDQAKGRVKQAVGALSGNEKLKAEGKVDEAVGRAKTAIGGAQKKVAVAVKAVRRAR